MVILRVSRFQAAKCTDVQQAVCDVPLLSLQRFIAIADASNRYKYRQVWLIHCSVGWFCDQSRFNSRERSRYRYRLSLPKSAASIQLDPREALDKYLEFTML